MQQWWQGNLPQLSKCIVQHNSDSYLLSKKWLTYRCAEVCGHDRQFGELDIVCWQPWPWQIKVWTLISTALAFPIVIATVWVFWSFLQVETPVENSVWTGSLAGLPLDNSQTNPWKFTIFGNFCQVTCPPLWFLMWGVVQLTTLLVPSSLPPSPLPPTSLIKCSNIDICKWSTISPSIYSFKMWFYRCNCWIKPVPSIHHLPHLFSSS